MPTTLGPGKVASCQSPCWLFYITEEGNDTGFDVSEVTMCTLKFLSHVAHVAHEDSGKLLPDSASLDPRIEVVLETTVDDA